MLTIVPVPLVARLPPLPIVSAFVFVPDVTLAKATESAVMPLIPTATPVAEIDH